jgi:hypothetical protein
MARKARARTEAGARARVPDHERRGVQRATEALREMLAQGKAPSLRELMRHMRETQQVACSMRDAVQAMRIHAQHNAKREEQVLRSVLEVASRRCDALDAVSRKRVHAALQHQWREVARAH